MILKHSINEIKMLDTKFNDLLTYYDENKDKPWSEWLEFDCLFEKPGKQGEVGLLKSKDGRLQYIFKMSQTMNFLSLHELTIMQGLNSLYEFCPHFCKGIGVINCDIEPDLRSKNPFKIKSKYPVEKEVLLCEYIDKSSKFSNYIMSSRIPEHIIFSVIKQVLLAIQLAQIETRFTHYDLHSDNIMVKKCNEDLVLLYKLDEKTQYCVPTLGYYPVIIDYGFSYIGNMEENPLWTSLAFTEVGFMSDRFDWVADPKLFLVTVSYELKKYRSSRNSRKLRNIVYNVFGKLDIDMSSGWDREIDKSAIDNVSDELQKHTHTSKIFRDYEYICLDILQSLIILPLEEQSEAGLDKAFEIFIKEWVKIEKEIASDYYNLFIFKEMVSIARDIRCDYENGYHNEAVLAFRRGIHEIVNKVSNFSLLQDIHYEKMLCALYLLSKSVEGMLYRLVSKRMEEKKDAYSKLPVQSVEEIYAIVETNIEDPYRYNKDTVVLFLDCVNQKYQIFDLPENEIDNINSLNSLYRGTYINDLFEKNNK